MARKPKPDKRLDWRNPNMRLVREYVITDDFGFVKERGTELVKPEIVKAEARVSLKLSDEPSWRFDPSYHWGRNRRRRAR